MELVSEFIAPRRRYVELLSTPLVQIEAQQEEARGNEKDCQDIQEYGIMLAICTVIEAKTVMYLLPRGSPSQSGHHLRSVSGPLTLFQSRAPEEETPATAWCAKGAIVEAKLDVK